MFSTTIFRGRIHGDSYASGDDHVWMSEDMSLFANNDEAHIEMAEAMLMALGLEGLPVKAEPISDTQWDWMPSEPIPTFD
jgi:hypothetical protein